MRLKFTLFLLSVACLLTNSLYADLVAQWKFDDPLGAVNETFEEISDAGAAAYYHDTVYAVQSEAGISGSGMGNAALFGGDESFFVINGPTSSPSTPPSAFQLGTGDFTIIGWVKESPVTNEDWWHMILFAGEHNVGGVNLSVTRSGVSSRGKLQFEIKGTDGGNVSIASDARIDDSNWHWFAAVSQADGLDQRMDLYIDGVLQSISGFYLPGTTATTPPGTLITLGKELDGQLDDLRIYNTSLSGTVDGNYTLTSGELYDVWQAGPNYTTCQEVVLNGYGYAADINNDCEVNLLDIALAAADWLRCNKPQTAGCQTPWLP